MIDGERPGGQRIGYARVSTASQDPATQVAALEAAGCERVYVEKASGANDARPELAAALDYLRAGDTLVVTSLDRLGRSIVHMVRLVDQLRERQINLQSQRENVDLATVSGRTMLFVFALLAEIERAWIEERTQARAAAARAAGRKGGTRPKLVGPKLRTARELVADDSIPLAEIGRRLGVSTATLHRALPDEVRARGGRRPQIGPRTTTPDPVPSGG